ncbi:DUF6798 domain-containing protein [Patescibacteria group bacterium]
MANVKTNFKDFLIIFLLTFLSFTIFGLKPLDGNNVVYLPFMEKIQNYTLFPKDMLLESISYHPSLFFNFVVKFSNTFNISIKSILVFLPLAIGYFTALIIFKLQLFLFKDKKSAYFLLVLLMSAKFSLAFEPISINMQQATPTTFSIPFAILAVYLYLKKKTFLSFFILGLIANIQPILAAQLGIVMFIGQTVYAYKNKCRLLKVVKKLFIQSGLVLLGSFPILLNLILNKGNFNFWLDTPGGWLNIIKIRTAHHFLASTWQFRTWLILSLYILLYIFSFKYKNAKLKLRTIDLKVLYLILSFIPLIFIAYFFSEVIPFRLIMIMSLYRGFWLFNLLVLSYISLMIINMIKGKEIRYKIFGLFIFCLLFLPTNIWYSDSLLKASVIGITLFFSFTMSFIVITNKKKSQSYTNKVLVVLLLMFLFISGLQRMYRNFLRWEKISLDNSFKKDWINVQLWAYNNTKVNDLFLTPVNQTGFRVYSQRPIMGEYKDGANLIYHPKLLNEWWNRMQEMGVDKSMTSGAYVEDLKMLKNEQKIVEIAEKYKASFLVSSYNNLSLNKAYENSSFSIYRIK